MFKVLPPLVMGLFAWSPALAAPQAAHAASHRILAASQIVWGPGPASLPPGAQSAVLYGDPGKDGPFAMRLKAPKGYVIPPHIHPRPEIVTVLSGTVRLGIGAKVDAAGSQAVSAGGFYSTEPGTTHFIIFEEDAVVQVNSNGPWGISFPAPTDASAGHAP